MIVWLASYPRSGNTLLRTILRRCFGLCSMEDVRIDRPGEMRDNPDMIGHLEKEESWEEFYQKASTSNELFLVKTHLPPRDEAPFIYVVRDGRLSVKSYRKFHRDYNGIDKSIASLIVGDDDFGDWTTHYKVWNDRPGPERLLLRFEELVDVAMEDLKRIAGFIGYTGEITPWQNPIGQFREVEPNFFNRADTNFSADSQWGPAERFLFEQFHGELMRSLGYEEDLSCNFFLNQIPVEFRTMAEVMVPLLRRLAAENHEKTAVIHDLDRRLKAVTAQGDKRQFAMRYLFKRFARAIYR